MPITHIASRQKFCFLATYHLSVDIKKPQKGAILGAANLTNLIIKIGSGGRI